jgi:hypothetical protein
MRTALALFLIATFSAPTFAGELVWKTEVERPEAKELPNCDIEKDKDCSDSVPYLEISEFGANMYLTYFEGVRAGIGFGSKPNQATQFASEQLHPGGYDWGGTVSGKKFKPLYVIKRFYEYESRAKTFLIAFRLLENGTSCVVDLKGKETSSNSQIRALVEKDFKSPKCSE